MAVKASASVTLSCYRDTESITRYYKLQSSTLAFPSKPTIKPPQGWTDTEPSYINGSTNTLYFCDLTVFSDGTWAYSNVSRSSSYEAAKEAYNKAYAAQQSANNANDKIDNLEVGGRNYLLDSEKEQFTNAATHAEFLKTTFDLAPFFDSNGLIEVTLSFDAYAENPGRVMIYSQNGSGARYSFTKYVYLTTEWARYSITFTPDLANSNIVQSYLAFYGVYDSGVIPHIRKAKMEKGNMATDWSLAPEDMATSDGLEAAENAAQDAADQLNNRLEQAESRISQIADSISTMVVDSNGASLMEQTSNGWIFSMGETLAQLQSAIDGIKSLETDINTQGGDISSLQNVVNGIEKLTSYIQITMDGSEPCIELGNEGSFKVLITNTAIKFMDGTTTPAYVTNQSLKIGKAEVEDELAFGGFAFAERSNGNMGLIWKGRG